MSDSIPKNYIENLAIERLIYYEFDNSSWSNLGSKAFSWVEKK